MPEKDDEEGFGVNLNNYIKLDGMQARSRRGNQDKGKRKVMAESKKMSENRTARTGVQGNYLIK